MIGRVRSFKDTWGFLRSDAVDGDIFVGLKSNPHLRKLAENDAVLFELQKDARGKNEAVNVQPLISDESARQTGWVRNFAGSWGFINSDSIQGDLFVGLRNNPQLSSLTAGDQVSFLVRHLDGKPEAVEVQITGASGTTLVHEELQGTLKSFREPSGLVSSDLGDLVLQRKHCPELGPVRVGDPLIFQVREEAGKLQAVGARILAQDVKAFLGHRINGWVKSFKDSWGLLSSPYFVGDLFVGLGNNPQLSSLKAGEAVTFTVDRDEVKGKCQASDVERGDGMVGANLGQGGVPAGNLLPSPKDMIGHTCVGVVKSFRDDWGFVNSEAFQGDLFLHLGSNPGLPALQPGEVVEFAISASKDDKMHATNVQRVTREPVLSQLVGKLCTGTVRKFSGEWGFINSPHFNGDLFVGLRSNRQLVVPLTTGDIVEFQVVRDVTKHEESYEASNVRVLSAAPTAPLATGAAAMAAPAVARLGPVASVAAVRVRSRSPRRGVELIHLQGQRLTGTIRSFRRDWGFVTSTAFPGDLFVGTRSNPHLRQALKEGDRTGMGGPSV